MKKSDILAAIMRLAPSHPLLEKSEKDINYQEARKVLDSLKKDRELKRIKCTVIYREETKGDLMSWKLRMEGQSQELTYLYYGKELPRVGMEVVCSLTQEDGSSAEVVAEVCWTEEHLKIVTGDLMRREEFDPRRIYSTGKGVKVVYKREDGERVILWSYQKNDEISLGRTYDLTWTDAMAVSFVVRKAKKSQQNVSAWLIAYWPLIQLNKKKAELRECPPDDPHREELEKEIAAYNLEDPNNGIRHHELDAELIAAFPQHQVGARHGRHYLSLARTGKLPEAQAFEDDPRRWR